MNSLPKTVTRQRHSCDLNPGPSAPVSSMLTTRLPRHPTKHNTLLFYITKLPLDFTKKVTLQPINYVQFYYFRDENGQVDVWH